MLLEQLLLIIYTPHTKHFESGVTILILTLNANNIHHFYRGEAESWVWSFK